MSKTNILGKVPSSSGSSSSLSLKAGIGLRIYSPGTEIINFKNSNCTITNKIATGSYANSALIDLDLHPVYSDYNSWEYQLEYTHASQDRTFPKLIAHRGTHSTQGIFLSINRGNDNFRLALASANGYGTIFDICDADMGLAAVEGTTYFIKVGFDGTKYYFHYNVTGWTDTFTEAWSLSTTTKVYNNPYWYTTDGTNFYGGRITLLGEVIETGYNNGSINLATFKFIADGVTVFEPYQTDADNTIVKVVTE